MRFLLSSMFYGYLTLLLTLCIQEIPERVLILLDFIRVYTVKKVKKNFRQKNTIFFENYNLTPLDWYNGPPQVYCIKPEGRIH